MQVLDTGYRVPRQILDFASMLLPALAPGLAPARSLRQDPGSLTVTPVMPRALPGHPGCRLRAGPRPARLGRGHRLG